MDAPIDLAAAGRRLEAWRRRQRECLALAAGLAAAVAGVAAVGLGVSWPLLVGAAAAAMGCLWAHSNLRSTLTQLVAQGDAWSLPAVRAHAARLVDRRWRIASGLRRVVNSCRDPSGEMTLVQVDRVDAHWQRLERLAEAFADPQVTVHPVSAALCVRMLREPVTSPLYNPRLPEHELDRLLTAIEAGVAM